MVDPATVLTAGSQVLGAGLTGSPAGPSQAITGRQDTFVEMNSPFQVGSGSASSNAPLSQAVDAIGRETLIWIALIGGIAWIASRAL